jgi:hypothetical protein
MEEEADMIWNSGLERRLRRIGSLQLLRSGGSFGLDPIEIFHSRPPAEQRARSARRRKIYR